MVVEQVILRLHIRMGVIDDLHTPQRYVLEKFLVGDRLALLVTVQHDLCGTPAIAIVLDLP